MSVRAFLRELPSLGNTNQYRFSKSFSSSSSSRHGVRALSGQCQAVSVERVVTNHAVFFPVVEAQPPRSFRNGKKVEWANNLSAKVIQPMGNNEKRSAPAENEMEKLRAMELNSLEHAHFYTRSLSENSLSPEATEHCFSKVFTYAINPSNDPGIREFIISCMPFKEISDENMVNQSLNLLLVILNNPNESSDLKGMVSKQLCTWIWSSTVKSGLNPLRERILDALLSFKESGRCDDAVWIINQNLIQAVCNFQKMVTYIKENPAFKREAVAINLSP